MNFDGSDSKYSPFVLIIILCSHFFILILLIGIDFNIIEIVFARLININ